MGAILRISIIVAITVMPSGALREHGTGVCPKRETTVVSDTETFMESYASMYETCTAWVFCRTKYRLGYRSRSRSVYKAVENELLTCCPGYSEVDSECKLKATVSVRSESKSTISPAFTSSTSSFSPSEERSTEEISTTLSNFQVENDPLPLVMTMMISGVVVIVIIVGITSLALIFLVFKRRKRKRFQAASSPLQREGRENGQEPHVQYYAVIPESSTEASSVVIGTPPLNPSPPTGPKQSTKKKNKLNSVPLSMKKNSIGVKMRTDSVQDEQDVSNKLLSEDLSHHYTDMNHPEPGPTTTGYIDMQSPNAKTAQSMGYTYMSQNSDGYSEMNAQEQSTEDIPLSSECEAYDMLNLAKRPPMEDNCYDKLDRSSDLLCGSAVTNNYDMGNNHVQIGSTQDEDSGEVQQESDTHDNQENLYSYPQNNCVLDSTRDHDNDKEAQYINSRCKESEPTYYNNTGETRQLPEDLNDVSIYTNVS